MYGHEDTGNGKQGTCVCVCMYVHLLTEILTLYLSCVVVVLDLLLLLLFTGTGCTLYSAAGSQQLAGTSYSILRACFALPHCHLLTYQQVYYDHHEVGAIAK